MNDPAKKPAKESKYAKLDHRHAAEQDAIGQPRFVAGSYYGKVRRCYAVDGDPAIWVPEVDVTYFVAEIVALPMHGGVVVGSWVNRLRFNGMAQLKEFVLVATDTPFGSHSQITEDDLEEIVGSANPLKDAYLRFTVANPVDSGYMHHGWRRLSTNERGLWPGLIDQAVEKAGL